MANPILPDAPSPGATPDGHPLVQQRPPIRKGEGVTPSERHLAKLAETSFLNLWSYPTPYRDQKQNGTGDGKELCDLIVVCSPYVIVFSEKTVAWPKAGLELAWSRWFKRAIRNAVKQARGAERWIQQHPDRVFLDRSCETAFPIAFPEPDVRRVHRVVVASGASDACAAHTDSTSGSLIVSPHIEGDAHWDGRSANVEPFHIGDVDPDGPFVHVFANIAFDRILRELDTIRDFTDYLEKRAAFIRSRRLGQAIGEENLLAYYAVRMNDRGEHDFVSNAAPTKTQNKPIMIGNSEYSRMISNAQYIGKKTADEISYLWDRLIETFTRNMLDGTSITLPGYSFVLAKSELGVRHMALQTRFKRRGLAVAVGDALDRGLKEEMFFRAMVGKPGQQGSEIAFFIITLKRPQQSPSRVSYVKYRQVRTEISARYALGILDKYPHIERIVGIACEPPDHESESSEDMIYAERSDWTQEERQRIRDDCNEVGILRDDVKVRSFSDDEFPKLSRVPVPLVNPEPPTPPRMNRRQRRAWAARQRTSRHRRNHRDS